MRQRMYGGVGGRGRETPPTRLAQGVDKQECAAFCVFEALSNPGKPRCRHRALKGRLILFDRASFASLIYANIPYL